jgi:nitrogen fixation protein
MWELTNPESEVVTVTYNSNGGNFDNSFEVVEGFTIEEPVNPSKLASIFIGWFVDEELSIPWNFDTDIVISDVTLYAKWEVNISELPKLPTPINGASHTASSTHFGIGVYGPGEEYRNYYANTLKIKFTNIDTDEVFTDTFNAPYGLGYAYTYGHLDLPMGTYTFGWAAVAVGTTYQDSDYFMFPATITIAPKTLEAPVIVVNQEVKTISWNLLTNAASYDVIVGDAEYENQTSPFSLDFLTEPGQYSVNVIAYGNVGYTNSEATTTYTVPSLEAEKLATPSNLNRNEFTLTWDLVTNAVGYEVRIGEVIKSSATNSFNLAAFDLTGEQTVYVRALGDVINFNDSDESEGFVTIIPGLLPRLTAMTAGDQNGDINGYGNGYYRLVIHTGHPVFATQLDHGGTGQFRFTVKQGDTILGSIVGANGFSLHTPGSTTDFYGALLTNGQNYTVEIVLIGDGVAYRDSLPLAINFTFIKG